MDRHKCKLCLKSFLNGRALGGHMRSHMMNLPLAVKQELQNQQQQQQQEQVSDDTESASSASYSDEDNDEKGLSYGLRENPKKSFRLADPEFFDAGSVVLQDRESETESSKNPTRRRSKRTRKSTVVFSHQEHVVENVNKADKLQKLSKSEPFAAAAVENEPVSSISDAATEEDVAFCLMMLSRDKWKGKQVQTKLYEDDDDQEADKSVDETEESEEQKLCNKTRSRSKGKYKCETCNKVFKSYQALGGHRASHKKIKVTTVLELEHENAAGTSASAAMPAEKTKIHECPFCSRVFSSGQALGGHKRSHFTGNGGGVIAHFPQAPSTSTKLGEHLIDLNLPPVEDDEDFSQIELSAVSDAEFVNNNSIKG